MWPFLQSINLIRYLIVLRVNTSLVRMPSCLSLELSLVLGHIILDRLPARDKGPWRKALAPWEAFGGLSVIGEKKPEKPVPEILWPTETVLFVYPGKSDYGKDELIFLELKLLGESADHGLFLETILPALEQAGYDSKADWAGKTTLWGHFDVHAVYAAKGPHWEAVVRAGELDLRYQASTKQWAHRLKFNRDGVFQHLTWLTPFDFGVPDSETRRRLSKKNLPAPSLRTILDALVFRISQLLPGKYNSPEDVWKELNADQQFSLLDAMGQASEVACLGSALSPVTGGCPGNQIGSQTFNRIPLAVVPYLELASILHVGKQTHFGCGTFRIANDTQI